MLIEFIAAVAVIVIIFATFEDKWPKLIVPYKAYVRCELI